MKRRKFSPEIKRKIAIEAVREQRTINEIAGAYEVHPVQVRKWKKELLDGAKQVFEAPNRKIGEQTDREEEVAKLQQKVGQLTIEIDWLKKKLAL